MTLLPEDPVLTVWQLLRLHTLLRMVRSGAGNTGVEASSPPPRELVNVHFVEASIAQSFIEKSFDQLREVCTACGWIIEAFQPKGRGGVTVSLYRAASPSDAAAVPSPLTVDDADAYLSAVDEALLAKCVAAEWSVEQTIQNVVQSAGSLWSNMLSLSTLAPCDPMMSHLGMMGGGGGDFNPEMFKMMLASNAAGAKSSAPGPSEDDIALKNALLSGVKVVLTLSTDELAASASFNESTQELYIALPSSTATSPAAQLFVGIALALEKAVPFWHSASSRHPAYRPAQRGGDNGLGVPPMLLFAAVISGDRKQRSSLLRYPRPLLEQVLWHLSPIDQRTADGASPVALDGVINTSQFEKHVSQHRIEVEFPQPMVDEEPLDEETDEEYFARIRPKTYLDLCASYLPSRIKS
ncbi:Hypothetical protein, putative [Bodo saltans]|uniref:Uncharacterized protein n=1 Tax=Bodo saltans TaxID=75058 RepID=A0A0S4IWZ7_BODSA|nr:Hypothetical protein, putative [Bodo saltans]|eukprot:CUG06323.1 Hypothetical protein, putative [Bodo saltans]